MKPIKIPKPSKSDLNKALKTTQTVVNEYIRKRDGNVNGVGKCCSCGNIKKLEAGHYFNVSSFPSLRFDEDNIHGQCKACNCAEKSDYRSAETVKLNYTSFIIRKYGESKHEELRERSKQIRRFRVNELAEIRKYYRKKLKELE